LSVQNFLEFGTLAVFSAALFYGLFAWFAASFSGFSNKKIQIILSGLFFVAFAWFTIQPTSAWSEFANFIILMSLLYGLYCGVLMRKKGRKKDGTYFILLTAICILLVIDEILLWSTSYRPSLGFMPLDLYPFVFSFLMNWKLISSFNYRSNNIQGNNLESVRDSETLILLPMAEVEKKHITKVLEETSWKISGHKGAAQILDLHPNTLRSRMKKLNIQRDTEHDN